MCFPPLVIAGIAASLAGAGMQFVGQRKADNAMQHTFNREQSRQKGFEKEQIGRFEDSLASTQGVTDPAKMAAAAARREAAFSAATKSASPAEEGYLPGSASAPAIVANAAEKAGAKADANTASLGAALARLGGLTDQMQENDINIGRNSQSIAQIGGFKRGSLDAMQAEMRAAKEKGSTLRTLGGLAQAMGSIMSAGAAAGVGGAAPIGVLSQGPITGASLGLNPASLVKPMPLFGI